MKTRRVRRSRIRGLARTLLSRAGISGPSVPVEKLARDAGLEIRYSRDPGSNISGFLYTRGVKPVIGVNAFHPPTRQRFTIAHELGHFSLHRLDVYNEDIHVDKVFRVKYRDDLSSEGTDIDEREANLFAAELLMPVDFLQQDLKDRVPHDFESEELLQDLADRYQVSQQAMLFRLTNLNYISF